MAAPGIDLAGPARAFPGLAKVSSVETRATSPLAPAESNQLSSLRLSVTRLGHLGWSAEFHLKRVNPSRPIRNHLPSFGSHRFTAR